MNFADVKAITIPEGSATKISVGGNVIWNKIKSITAEDMLVKDTGAILIEQWNLTPNSSIGGKNNDYFTFKEIPIEPGATYYAQYGTRSWYFDKDKNSVKTLNLVSKSGTGSDVVYEFVVPANVYYISISYSYAGAGSADNVYIRKVV